MYWRLRIRMYLAITTTGILVSSLQDPIGISMSNHPHKQGQKTPMKITALTEKLQSNYSAVHSRPEMPKTAEIRLSDHNLREEKPSFQPDQPGGNFFWVTTELFAEKNSLKPDFFLDSVIRSLYTVLFVSKIILKSTWFALSRSALWYRFKHPNKKHPASSKIFYKMHFVFVQTLPRIHFSRKLLSPLKVVI